MSPPSSDVQDLSRQIVERELAGRTTPAEIARAVEAALERLHQHISPVVGHVGFGAVMERAVHLTTPAFPWLEGVELHIEETLTMTGLSEAVEREGAASTGECAMSLLASVLELLASFIGEDLTLRLVRRVWADLPERGPGRSPGEA